jgi:LmbE family N-acetylglucosaminyl deacetylase
MASLPIATIMAMLAASSMATAQVRATYDQGAGGLTRQLQRLQTTASVLHTGAHPDDEDSALVAYHARHENARTAYLSLTRGAGGQNIIGTEQSDLLGVIRTEELLQARRLDGAEQFFTRAVDYGFSKHRAEAARLWNEEIILEDMVRVIRRFRPDVIISRWNGSPSDGHGHHQFAGHLTPMAFEAAADPDRFPGQLAEGLAPWQAGKLYVSERRAADALDDGLLVVNTGIIDPVAGRSYFQIGMQGRSQQKTQQMGSLELSGRQESALRLASSEIDSDVPGNGLFAGMDTSIQGIANHEDRPSAALLNGLSELGTLAAEALRAYDPLKPESLMPVLANGLAKARELRQLASSPDAIRLLDEKVNEFSSALFLAAGVTLDALVDAETVVPGGSLQVAVRAFDSAVADANISDVTLTIPEAWDSSRSDGISELGNEQSFRRKEQATTAYFFNVAVPADAVPTEPYWLVNSDGGFVQDWSGAGSAGGHAFAAPLIVANIELEIAGQTVQVTREAEYRYVDRIRGEVRRRVDVVPRISLNAATDLVILPSGGEDKTMQARIAVTNNGANSAAGQVRLELPEGWVSEPALIDFSLAAAPANTSTVFAVTLPDNVKPAGYTLSAVARVDGLEYRQSMNTVAYDHIRTHRDYRAASIEVQVIEVDVAPVRTGYIMGSGDKVPEAMRRLGLDIALMDDAMLATGDLSQFDTIVVGIRASQTRPAFVANNGRLLEFARNGGALIVQYQQRDYIEKGLAPYSASMGDRTVRVVDETAPVTILQPAHPVFSFPNRITNRDFDGWVQERNNYNFASFDQDRYVALTESHDDDEAESIGAMVYAEIGNGHYIYTGYSWFRQLPNGVPGAYRLFANLISLPAAPR